MAEFYFAYDWQDLHYLAVVIAPARPATLQFSDYEALRTTMDDLGHEWQLQGEIPDPNQFAFDSASVWLRQMAEVKALKLERKPDVYLWSSGGDVGFAS